MVYESGSMPRLLGKLGALLLFAVASPAPALRAQTLGPTTTIESVPAKSWAEAAAANEQRIIRDDGQFPLRYRIRKVDAKNDTTRDMIESRQGAVGRLVQRNGQPLSATEDAAERERLNGLLTSPKDFMKHHKRDETTRNYSVQLVGELPGAMLFTYAPGQPQRPSFATPQVVIDFTPDPTYKSQSMITQMLTGLEGRAWIDRSSLRVLRIEGRVLHPIDIGWGMVAKVFPGGTIELEQVNAGSDRWTFSHLRSNLTIREMMVKTVQQRTAMDAAAFKILPAPVDFQDAIRLLLATPSETR